MGVARITTLGSEAFDCGMGIGVLIYILYLAIGRRTSYKRVVFKTVLRTGVRLNYMYIIT